MHGLHPFSGVPPHHSRDCPFHLRRYRLRDAKGCERGLQVRVEVELAVLPTGHRPSFEMCGFKAFSSRIMASTRAS